MTWQYDVHAFGFICILGVVSSICKKLGIPHFIAHWDPPEESIDNPHHNFTHNLYPKADALAHALFDIVADFEWKKFTIIYEDGYSLMRLHDIMQAHEALGKSVAIYQLPDDSNFKPLLKRISKTGMNRFIIDCSLDNLGKIIQQGIQFNLTQEYIVSNDGNHSSILYFCNSLSIRSELLFHWCRFLYARYTRTERRWIEYNDDSVDGSNQLGCYQYGAWMATKNENKLRLLQANRCEYDKG